jgi:GTP-binding protein EngB required for normal cell division
MSATLTAQLPGSAERLGLSSKLAALARLVQIGDERRGPDGFSEELLTEASDLLNRAGQRLMLSASHTVVSLAGGTGSGKSSLFNQLAGADFSAVGVTRPVTSEAHACVWGVTGSGPLLEWLSVPRRYRYARASALSRGEPAMSGLVLLDLPDHDSVMGHATGLVDKLVGRSDLLIWVLDPQKYADAAVHRRFLVPLGGHSEVIAVVLNQCDLLTPGQIEDCLNDLRRLLDEENLLDVQILVTSAATGAGLEELRKLLIDAVSARKAAAARISADVDKIVARFEPYGALESAGEAGAEDMRLASGIEAELAASFASAAGVGAIGDALRGARELRAMDYVGWPVTWLAERITRRDPARKVRLGWLWEQVRGITAGPSGAQQAEIDTALTRIADAVPPLPRPWSRTVRAAVRSEAHDIPPAVGAVIGDALPPHATVDRWWRMIGVVQGLLLGCAMVGIAWFIALLVFGVGGMGSGIPVLFRDLWMLPWVALLAAAGLVGGWLTARICSKAVREASERDTAALLDDIGQRLTRVAYDLVVVPADDELAEFSRFRAELRTAASGNLLR